MIKITKFQVLKMSNSHTILLIQSGASQETRTYTDFQTADDCLEVSFV